MHAGKRGDTRAARGACRAWHAARAGARPVRLAHARAAAQARAVRARTGDCARAGRHGGRGRLLGGRGVDGACAPAPARSARRAAGAAIPAAITAARAPLAARCRARAGRGQPLTARRRAPAGRALAASRRQDGQSEASHAGAGGAARLRRHPRRPLQGPARCVRIRTSPAQRIPLRRTLRPQARGFRRMRMIRLLHWIRPVRRIWEIPVPVQARAAALARSRPTRRVRRQSASRAWRRLP